MKALERARHFQVEHLEVTPNERDLTSSGLTGDWTFLEWPSNARFVIELWHSPAETLFGLRRSEHVHRRHQNRKTVRRKPDKTGDSLQDAQQMPCGSAADGFPSLVQRLSDGAEASNLAKCSSARG